MKVIVSHDVDHITAWEHAKDLIIPKFIVRSLIEFGLGQIAIHEVKHRLGSIIDNKWQNIEDLAAFDRQSGVPSTFFIAMTRGRGLSYCNRNAKYWIDRIVSQGLDVGVHGIEYDSLGRMEKENLVFRNHTGHTKFGIRMHYLRTSPHTMSSLNELGYAFDSSQRGLRNPHRLGGLWEFPLHLMEGDIILNGNRWQSQSLEQARMATMRFIDLASKRNIDYLTVLFHDSYFCNGFSTWKNWYTWLISYCKENRLEFISFANAIEELQWQNKEEAGC